MPRDLTPQEESNRDFNQSQSDVGGVLKTLKGTPIKRYKNLVGKEVGGQLYLHKLYVDIILQSGGYKDISENDYNTAKDSIGDFNFNCVMLDSKRRVIRFDEAPDFDTSREPIPGKTVSVVLDGATLSTGYSDQIWHHKWMWVMNDYTGFDVRESWEWSKTYLSVLRDTEDKVSNRGIANGTGHGDSNWRAQLRYFGLEEATSVINKIISSVAFVRDHVAEDVRENEIDQFDADFLNVVIDECEAIYKDYNEGKISAEELEQRAREQAKEIIFQYSKESGQTKRDLQDILSNFDEDLLDVDIDLGTDISAMTIKEAEEPMEGNRPFDQALELMDKFDYALMDYDEGALSKETIAQKFDTLKTKVEMLKKECEIEDRTFLNEKMKQFKEILNYYNIPLEECNESKKITESSQSPMIFKAGNVYRLTPNYSYAYDRVEILGIAWNDMVGQCTVQYKVIMKDGSVEEGQSEARDLISTIKKNNQDRVEFYKTEVPQMNESQTLTEATVQYQSKLARYINNTVQDCINHGEGAFKSGEMGLEIYAEWADNEDDIHVTIRSEGKAIKHTELGVASVIYDRDSLA